MIAALPSPSDPPAHEHDWQLREVDYEDSLEVREYTCTRCGMTTYR